MAEHAHYAWLRTGPLGADERRRLRMAVALERRARGLARGESGYRIVDALAAFLEAPDDGLAPELLAWLCSYATARTLAELAASPAAAGLARPALRSLVDAAPEALLPREHVTPDLQRVGAPSPPRSALVCFTGKARKLNIPVQLFHCLAAGRFDAIWYLRDRSQQGFAQGMPGLWDGFEALCAGLRTAIPRDCQLAVLGTSAGGWAAARFAEAIGATRLLLASPPFRMGGVPAVGAEPRMPVDAVCIYVAAGSACDLRHSARWMQSPYAASVRWLDTGSHGTLHHLYAEGALPDILDWLAGGPARLPPGTALPPEPAGLGPSA